MKPHLDDDALHGLPGEFVRTIEPYSEADPAAVLATMLTTFGALVGPSPRIVAGGVHTPRLHTLIIGRSSKARKGSSAYPVFEVFEQVDPEWCVHQVLGGFGSGEAVIATVAAGDRRVLVREDEFGRVLAIAARQGSTISQLLRTSWDSGKLENRVKDKSQTNVVTDAHVALIAHVTIGEFLDRLQRADVSGGTVNRLLMVAAGRSKNLSRGAHLPGAEVDRLARLTRDAVTNARKIGTMRWTDRGGALWDVVYEHLAADDPPAPLGDAIARAEAQTLRLAITYAAADGTPAIDVPHIAAAYAVWRYCRDTAASIFPSRPLTDDEYKLLEAVVAAGDAGMTASEQRDLFGRHRTAQQHQAMRERLERLGLAQTGAVPTGGRNAVVTIATGKGAESVESAESASPSPLPALNALIAQTRSLNVLDGGGA